MLMIQLDSLEKILSDLYFRRVIIDASYMYKICVFESIEMRHIM